MPFVYEADAIVGTEHRSATPAWQLLRVQLSAGLIAHRSRIRRVRGERLRHEGDLPDG